MWYPAAARNVAQKSLPRRSSSNAYDMRDADAALESFNPVRKAQKAESSFSATARTRSDVLPSVSQRQLQRERTSEVDVGFALARDEHKRKNRRIDLTGLTRVLGNRSYKDDRVLLNRGERSKNDDFQKHSSASLIENEVKLQSPRALLDSVRADILASKVAQAESQNGDTYTTSNLKDGPTLASSIEQSTSPEILNQAAQIAEFNKALRAQRSSREQYLNNYWKRPHEAPVASPQRHGIEDGGINQISNFSFNTPRFRVSFRESTVIKYRPSLVNQS